MVVVRRKTGELLPIEVAILEVAQRLKTQGVEQFHGFALAKELQAAESARFLTASGKLYRALERLEEMGLLASEWEDPAIAAREDRPRRRFYHLIGNPVLEPAPTRSALAPRRFILRPEGA